MKGNRTYRGTIVSVVGLVLGLMLPAAMASAQGGVHTQVYPTIGKSASAHFASFDTRLNVSTEVWITAGDLAPLGGPQEISFVTLTIYQYYDHDPYDILHFASGGVYGPPGDPVFIQIAHDLSTATVTAKSVPVTDIDYQGSPLVSVDLSVGWNGTAGVAPPEPTAFGFPSFQAVLFTSATHAALATGTVSDGATNFTPAPASDAGIQAVDGQVIINY